mgnify:CR=1 FL=1
MSTSRGGAAKPGDGMDVDTDDYQDAQGWTAESKHAYDSAAPIKGYK